MHSKQKIMLKHWRSVARRVHAKYAAKQARTMSLKEALPFLLLILTGIVIFIIGTIKGYTSLPEVNAKEATGRHTSFLQQFPITGTQLVGCFSMVDYKIYDPISGSCVGIRCARNVLLPPRWQVEKMLRYWTEEQVVNRLALINYESAFRENVGNKYAYGYVQTLRRYNIKPDVDSQLLWLYRREQVILSRQTGSGSKRCGIYWDRYNYKDGYPAGMYGVLACYYRYHYHAYKGTWYARRGVITTKFYRSILNFNK